MFDQDGSADESDEDIRQKQLDLCFKVRNSAPYYIHYIIIPLCSLCVFIVGYEPV